MTNYPQPISHHLAKHLLAYATVAGAATAWSAPASAEVVYTPAHTRISFETPLDLNHDGINDFLFQSYDLSGIGSLRVFPLHAGNRLAATLQSCGNSPKPVAGALPSGAVIGPNRKFLDKATCMVDWSYYNGPWFESGERYLGLVFVITGEEHFGWARLTANGTLLLGYAYETTPNQPIIAGDEGNSANASAPSNTLGELALGSTAKISSKKKPLIL